MNIQNSHREQPKSLKFRCGGPAPEACGGAWVARSTVTLGKKEGRSHRRNASRPWLGSVTAHAGPIGRGLEKASSILHKEPRGRGHEYGPVAQCRNGPDPDSGREGHDAPARPVPVLDERTGIGAGGPDVIGRDGRDRPQAAVDVGVRIRTGDDAPARAVPVHDVARGKLFLLAPGPIPTAQTLVGESAVTAVMLTVDTPDTSLQLVPLKCRLVLPPTAQTSLLASAEMP